jgi:NADH:ubiquinone reductase (H+-translocating)
METLRPENLPKSEAVPRRRPQHSLAICSRILWGRQVKNMRKALEQMPRVVVVGGGFGGTHAAHTLRNAPVRVTVIDRTNHSIFHPLLYQVASAGLSSDEIAVPIRFLLRRQRNSEVMMAEVTGVDVQQRRLWMSTRQLSYDYLILATGSN